MTSLASARISPEPALSVESAGGSRPAPSSFLLAATLCLAAAVIALVPTDFVAVAGPWRLAGLYALLVGGLVAIRALTRVRAPVVWAALGFIALLIAFNQFANYNPVAFVTLLLPVVVGAGLAATGRWVLGSMVAFSVIVAVTLGIEFALQQHIFGPLFGAENYVAQANTDFRARGIIGQAVPAAMVAIGVCGAVLILTGRSVRHQSGIRWCVLLSTAVSVVASGTRSSIVCALILGVICLIARLRVGRLRAAVVNAYAVWIGPMLLAVGLVIFTTYWSRLAGQRLFSFDELAGSESFENRNYASIVYGEWVDRCDGLCLGVGFGARNLLQTLSGGLGFRGFTTVDNMFVSLLWDFGIPAAVGLASLVFVALRSLFTVNSPTVRAGAVIVLSVLISGLFYDALYIRPVLLLFGLGIGMLGVTAKRSAES